MKKGSFDTGGVLPKVLENVTLIKGYFQETLDDFLDDNTGPVAFVNLDADTYESTLFVLEVLETRLIPGTLILFDEFFGFHGWQMGEYRAWTEFCSNRRINFRYIAHSHEQCLIQIGVA